MSANHTPSTTCPAPAPGWRGRLERWTRTGCVDCGRPGKLARYLIWIGLPLALLLSVASTVLAMLQR